MLGLNWIEPTTCLVKSFQMQRRVEGYSRCVPVPTKKKMFEFLYESHKAIPPGMLALILAAPVEVSQTRKPLAVATIKCLFWLINFIEFIDVPDGVGV